MKLTTGLISILALGAIAVPTASAMSATECVALQKSLSSKHASLSEQAAELKALGETAEALGDQYADAKERSGLDRSYMAKAEELGAQHDAIKARIEAGNADMAEKSLVFNQSQKEFQAGCSRYFAKN